MIVDLLLFSAVCVALLGTAMHTPSKKTQGRCLSALPWVIVAAALLLWFLGG